MSTATPSPTGAYFQNGRYLQLSTFAGVPTSLSGPPIAGLKTFDGTGTVHRIAMTGGVVFRF